MEVILRKGFCSAEDFTPIIAQRIDACLDAKPSEVTLERSRDVRLAASLEVRSGQMDI